MAGILGPLEFGRKLGLNIPTDAQIRGLLSAIPEWVGPQADVRGMVQDSSRIIPNVKAGNYGQALGNLGMAIAAIPMMASPGTVASVKKGVKKGVQGLLSPTSAERVAALRAEGNATRFGDEVPVNIDYRGRHTAPLREGKNTLDDMSDIYPDDIYDPSVAGRYYGHGGDSVGIDNQSARIIAKAKANPNGEIEIFRAAPKGTKNINEGDWVTVNKDYAKTHGDAWVENGEYDIISKKVKISDLATDGNSIHEFGYSPKLTVAGVKKGVQGVLKPGMVGPSRAADNLMDAIRTQDNPNAMKALFLDDDFAREVAGEYLGELDNLPSMNVVGSVRAAIRAKAQDFLKDQPEIMTVYRSGNLRPGEVQSFTTNPNYSVRSNLPWNQGPGGSVDKTIAPGTELISYQVKKSDISGVPDSLSVRGKFGEDELLINSDFVRRGILTPGFK